MYIYYAHIYIYIYIMCTQPNAYKRCAHTELAAANLPYTCVYIYIYIYIYRSYMYTIYV